MSIIETESDKTFLSLQVAKGYIKKLQFEKGQLVSEIEHLQYRIDNYSENEEIKILQKTVEELKSEIIVLKMSKKQKKRLGIK